MAIEKDRRLKKRYSIWSLGNDRVVINNTADKQSKEEEKAQTMIMREAAYENQWGAW